MAIETRTNRIHVLLSNHLKAISSVVAMGGLDEDTIKDLKKNAKDIIQDAKNELDRIKDEVDNW